MRILFLTHRRSACGVYEFGKLIYSALVTIKQYEIIYAEVESSQDVSVAIEQHSPSVILVNYHPLTSRNWLPLTLADSNTCTVGILHEISRENLESLDFLPFDYFMVHDPTLADANSGIYLSVRPLPQVRLGDIPPAPAQVTVGSFGFATLGKGFEALVARVQLEFSECKIRLNIPYSTFCDPTGQEALAVAGRCREQLWNPGVSLEITHDYLEPDAIIRFLQGNTLNAFFYEPQCSRGLSSALDWALAAGRPLALRKAHMFRHLFGVTPSPFVEDRSLKQILQDGMTWQARLMKDWSAERVASDYCEMLDKILSNYCPYTSGKHLACRLRIRRLQSCLAEHERRELAELQSSSDGQQLRSALAALADIQLRNDSLRSKLEESEAERQALSGSTSWRITKPLRWLVQHWRKYARGRKASTNA